MKLENANILMVNYHFPPVKGIGTLRIHKFYKSFGELAGKRFVITTSNRSKMIQEFLPVDESLIFECGTYDYRTFLSGFHKNKGSHFSFSKNVSVPMSHLRKLLVSFPTNLLIGEGGPTYIASAYLKAAKIIREQNINVIFSSYGPYVDHIICYLLKQKFPHLYWIADFRDIHTEPNLEQVILSGFQEKVLRHLLKKVDLVTTVSKGLSHYYNKFHDNVEVVANGFDPAQMQKFQQAENKAFIISYTGSVYKGLQNGSLIFKALDELIAENKIRMKDIRINYAGKDTHLFSEFLDGTRLKEQFVSHGLVSFKESQIIQQSSNINLLLSWTSKGTSGILTAKIFEYIYAQRPILTIINGAVDSDFSHFQTDIPNSLMVTMDEERDSLNQIKTFLLEKYKYWLLKGASETAIPEEAMMTYSWETGFAKFVKRIEGEQSAKLKTTEPIHEPVKS